MVSHRRGVDVLGDDGDDIESTERNSPSTVTVERAPSRASMVTSLDENAAEQRRVAGQDAELTGDRTSAHQLRLALPDLAVGGNHLNLGVNSRVPPSRGDVLRSLVPLTGCSVRDVDLPTLLLRIAVANVTIPSITNSKEPTSEHCCVRRPPRPDPSTGRRGRPDRGHRCRGRRQVGHGGAAVKAGYAAARKLGGDFVLSATDRLLAPVRGGARPPSGPARATPDSPPTCRLAPRRRPTPSSPSPMPRRKRRPSFGEEGLQGAGEARPRSRWSPRSHAWAPRWSASSGAEAHAPAGSR